MGWNYQTDREFSAERQAQEDRFEAGPQVDEGRLIQMWRKNAAEWDEDARPDEDER